MGILKFASDNVKRIDLGEGDWLDVKSDISKRAFNALVQAMPSREISEENGLTLEEGLQFQQALFEALVVGWSVPEQPTIENYLELSRAAADVIDNKLIEHFGDITPKPQEMSKAPTSPNGRRRASAPTA